MSERLLFELKAVDNATAPLRQVQNELQRTAGVAGSATKDFRKFALGGLQQAGFQVGDFAVQLANGTNQMQAFGQQAPQLLQIFGPIGSIVGAAVAVFAAFSVVMEKTKGNVNDYADAVKNLTEEIQKNQQIALNAKFGTDILGVASAKQQIQDIKAEIPLVKKQLEEYYLAVAQAGGISLGSIFGDEGTKLEGQLKTLDERLKTLYETLRVSEGIAAVEEASKLQNMIKLNLIDEQIKKNDTVHDALLAVQNANYKYIESQKISIGLLIQQYSLYGQIAKSAAAIATATQNTEYYKLGTLNAGAMGRAGAKGQGEAVNYSFVEPKKTGGGGSKEDPLKTLRDQLALETELLGKTEAQQRVIQALGIDWKKYGATTYEGLTQQIEQMAELNRVAEMQKEIANTIKSSMSDAFMSIVDGTKSVADAFKEMTRQIILKLYEQLVVQQMVNAAMGLLGSAFPAIAPMLSGVRAMGGPVTSGQPYMVGERGPEIIVPSRNGTVVPNNQLGGGGVTVVQNINITTGVQQTVRAEIKSLMPQIADSAKAAVLDAKRRGGSYGSAFA